MAVDLNLLEEHLGGGGTVGAEMSPFPHGEEKGLNLLTRVYRYSWSYPFIFLMRRVRVLGVGSDDKPLLQHRREVISIEVNPALDPDRRAKR